MIRITVSIWNGLRVEDSKREKVFEVELFFFLILHKKIARYLGPSHLGCVYLWHLPFFPQEALCLRSLLSALFSHLLSILILLFIIWYLLVCFLLAFFTFLSSILAVSFLLYRKSGEVIKIGLFVKIICCPLHSSLFMLSGSCTERPLLMTSWAFIWDVLNHFLSAWLLDLKPCQVPEELILSDKFLPVMETYVAHKTCIYLRTHLKLEIRTHQQIYLERLLWVSQRPGAGNFGHIGGAQETCVSIRNLNRQGWRTQK